MSPVRGSVRTAVKAVVPPFVVRGVRKVQDAYQRRRLPAARAAFHNAPRTPEYLEPHQLAELQDRYPMRPEYGYDPQSTDRRGFIRAKEILGIPGGSSAQTYLELGCWDGMVSCHLQRFGKTATALDIRDDGFDDRARRAGVTFVRMDAEALTFGQGSFDCVFSYDTFEHVAHPDIVLREATKVLKTGGHLFLSFGPLYFSPFGQHVYRFITVPYCHLLFPQALLGDFALARGSKPVDLTRVNGWHVAGYRDLWKQCASVLKPVRCEEEQNLAHLDLICSSPSCFRSKTGDFDDLTTETVTMVFEKIA